MVRSELSRRTTALILATLLVWAAAAWIFTIAQAGAAGMGGVAMMPAGLFLLTWLAMMIAMMLPVVAPVVLAFAAVTRARGEGYAPAAAFVGGYLVVWAAAGLVPLGVMAAVQAFWITPPISLQHAGGLALVGAGIYQCTPLKDFSLAACRSPFGGAATHDRANGASRAARDGVSHGLRCLGCCWALMAVLAVVGLMNVVWMAVVAAAFFVERNLRFGNLLAKGVGAACIAGGVALLIG